MLSCKEKAILVKQAPKIESLDNPLGELRDLAKSAGAEICAEMLSSRQRPHAASFIGGGKVCELAELVVAHTATLVLFDHAISPVQERNLERLVKSRVVSREGLILDIFAQRASTREGKLQVELAQLKHLSTRLVRGWTHLERQKGGIGLRGPGETQLETDRRLIGARIKTLNRCLNRVEIQRQLRRRSRHRMRIPTVACVGYTNAGKSSLFNRLTNAGVVVADQLFATLDPTMRRLEVRGYGPVVLSDTVGFIRQLPHTLVAAFRSTLEEVVNADLLLLVVDISDINQQELTAHVETVLDQIGASKQPRIMVYNKIDRLTKDADTKNNQKGDINRVWLSAKTGEGLDCLHAAISQNLGSNRRTMMLKLPPHAGAIRAGLYRRCYVLDERIDQSGATILQVTMDCADIGWFEACPGFLPQYWVAPQAHITHLNVT